MPKKKQVRYDNAPSDALVTWSEKSKPPKWFARFNDGHGDDGQKTGHGLTELEAIQDLAERLLDGEPKTEGIVLSIDAEYMEEKGYDAKWILKHNLMQVCANEYWEGISDCLGVYDPLHEKMEHLGIRKLRDENSLTDPNYWDCECAYHYIHPKSEPACPICGTTSDRQPDAMADEVKAQFGPAQDSPDMIVAKDGTKMVGSPDYGYFPKDVNDD